MKTFAFILIAAFLAIFGLNLIPNHPDATHTHAVEPDLLPVETVAYEPEPAPCFLGDTADVRTPYDVWTVFMDMGFSPAQAAFFAKQAAFETGDPNNFKTALNPINGAHNVFGLREGKTWFNYASKYDAVVHYAKSIKDSKYYTPDADPAFIVTERRHCPFNGDYAAQVASVKFKY